ncbi:MAG: sugar phosphate nucleotidyltransferase [Acidimicrobiia bacterium]|nr:sugar phosphate nucleotidyltransferase [Acidimicrobiia bacterium]
MTPTVAVIPAAGRGTRMRPATRVIPKAFLPLIDRPSIQYAAEEAAAAGATEIFTVIDPNVAGLIEGHFEEELASLVGVTVTPVVQAEPLGLGHAVACAAEAVGDRPFLCLLVDELLRPGSDVLGRLIAAAGAGSVVAVRTVNDPAILGRYGIVGIGETHADGSFDVTSAVEKPASGEAPSNLALVGRYLFQPEIFEALSDLEPGYGGEIQLTDGINRLAGRCRGIVADDDLLDIGNPLGMAKAKHLLASQHPEWGKEYRRFTADGN